MRGLRAQNKFVVITLGGRAVTASSLSFIFTSISIWREVVGKGGAARQIQTKQKMPHAPFPSQVRGHKRLFIFFPPFARECEPPEECFKEIPPGEDNKHRQC